MFVDVPRAHHVDEGSSARCAVIYWRALCLPSSPLHQLGAARRLATRWHPATRIWHPALSTTAQNDRRWHIRPLSSSLVAHRAALFSGELGSALNKAGVYILCNCVAPLCWATPRTTPITFHRLRTGAQPNMIKVPKSSNRLWRLATATSFCAYHAERLIWWILFYFLFAIILRRIGWVFELEIIERGFISPVADGDDKINRGIWSGMDYSEGAKGAKGRSGKWRKVGEDYNLDNWCV